MDLIRVEPVKTKGGSLRYYVQKVKGRLEDDGSVNKYLKLEEKSELYKKSTFENFSKSIDDLKFQSYNFLSEARKKKSVNCWFRGFYNRHYSNTSF